MNIKPNALFTGDNLYILNGMNSECVDLIYLDPPFNSKRMYKAPVGSRAAGAEFKDMWTWQDVDTATLERLVIDHPALVDYIQTIGEVHSKAMMSYITYMAQRIIQCRRVLKPTGSIYLHCDPTASHYLKLVLDNIFGRGNFRNEIVWSYRRWSGKTKAYQKMHDIILFYAKQDKRHIWNWPMEAKAKGTPTYKRWNEWDEEKQKLVTKSDPTVEVSETSMRDVWEIPRLQANSAERTGYPTQKPLALLERIVKASSNEGDIVLDPFCGCATAMVWAQQHRRKWIGIDIAEPAADILVQRLTDDAGILKDFAPGEGLDFIHRTDIPERTDTTTINLRSAAQKNAIKDRLYGTQGGDCAGCSRHFQKQDFHIDHIIPKDKGGGDYESNLQLLCGNCNSIKGNRPMEYLQVKIRTRREKLKQVSFGE